MHNMHKFKPRWLLFETTKQNNSMYVNNCFKDGELVRVAVAKESLTTATD